VELPTCSFSENHPRGGVAGAFRAGRLMLLHPGLKRPTSQSLRRGWLFGVTYHNMRGAIASATAAWAILLDRFAIIGKCPNTRRGRGRPRHIVGRASSPVRLPKTAWKLAKLQRPAGSGPTGPILLTDCQIV